MIAFPDDGAIGPAVAPAPLAWFDDAMRRALLIRLAERVMLTRFSITQQGRDALAVEEHAP